MRRLYCQCTLVEGLGACVVLSDDVQEVSIVADERHTRVVRLRVCTCVYVYVHVGSIYVYVCMNVPHLAAKCCGGTPL